jgi:flagellum-specific peptidoglycan hydrolase FlgJ
MRKLFLLGICLVLFSFSRPSATGDTLDPKKTTLNKVDKVTAYVERFKKTAMKEQELFGIPASITLAQGIIESNSGKSSLSRKYNNHFGMKWRKGRKEKFVIYADDRPDDRFVVYKSSWRSYRDHSKLLTNAPRYKKLFKLKRTDYKGWAKGLKECGYATNKNYDKILISVIEKYDLAKYDKEKKRFFNLNFLKI